MVLGNKMLCLAIGSKKNAGVKKPVMGGHRFFYFNKKEKKMRRKEQ